MVHRKLICLVVCILAVFSCEAQSKKKDTRTEQVRNGNPKVDVKVNKKYDKKGNLVSYDSTYTYFYTSKGRDSARVSLDTAAQRFRKYYDAQFSSMMKDRFDQLFLNDSLFKYDFPNRDYFTKRFELNEAHINSLFRQMDSLKNVYMSQPPARANTPIKK